MGYNVIWIDDECKSRKGELFIQRCKKSGVSITAFEYGSDALDELEQNYNDWHAVILDAKMLYKQGTPDVEHLYEVRDRLNKLAYKKYIPYYVLTAQPDLMDSSFFAKTVRCKVYSKLDLNAQAKLLEDIKIDTEKIDRRQVQFFYQDSIDYLKSLNVNASNVILDIFEAMHFPGKNQDFKPILYYNQLRQLLELIFRAANKVSIIPDVCFPKDKKEVNINQCFMYLIGSPAKKVRVRYGNPGERIIPKHIQDMISMILNLGNEKSHFDNSLLNDDELGLVKKYIDRNVSNSRYLIFSFALQLCEIALWMKNYISLNSNIEKNRNMCKVLYVGMVETIDNCKKKCRIGDKYCIDAKYVERNNYLGKKVIVLDEKPNGDSITQKDYPLFAIKIEEIE